MSKLLLKYGFVVALYLVGGEVLAQGGEVVSAPTAAQAEKPKSAAPDSLEDSAESLPDIGENDVQTLEGDATLLNDGAYAAYRDSSPVAARAIPTDALDDFRNNPNFQYDRVETDGPTLMELFWQWLVDVLFGPIRNNTTPQFWSWFWLIAGILAIAFVVSQALRADSGWFFRKKDNQVEPHGIVLLDTEDIESINLDALLDAALSDRRYRDATRYTYLLALQALTEQGLIDWDKHKTNREYVAEVERANQPALTRPFAEITRLFEWIWYGEFAMDEQRFGLARGRFDLFAEALRGVRR